MKPRDAHRTIAGALLAIAVAACGREREPMRTPERGGTAANGTAAGQEDGQWTMPAKDFANTRFSALDQITRENVRGLRMVWSFATGTLRGHEGQPLVVDNTMYIVTPYPNVVYAFDLTQPGYPLRWKYRPNVASASQGVACCDVVNRGAAYADGRIVFNTLDNHTIALDAKSGRELWNRTMGTIDEGQTMTMVPLIVKGKVIVGNSGGEFGVRGWLAALDLATGAELWRGYNAGPDDEMLVDPGFFRPPYVGAKRDSLGMSTWPADHWKIGGATAWGWISYDPELDLIYYGTSNPGPWNDELRPGDNKWATSTLARDPDDGRLRWAYQQTPHDEWDYDGVNENILVTLPIGGADRRVLVRFDRNGFVYVQDRASGEVLSATPFVAVNWATGVDLRTGRPHVVEEKRTGPSQWTRNICPSLEGGKDQQPAAFSPRTRLFYSPTNNICMDWLAREVSYIAGTPYIGASAPYHAGPGDGHRGEFIAWDPVAGRKVWGIEEQFPVWGGALVTGGDIVFYGTLDGFFKAVDARTGEVLWQLKLGSGIVGNPITYLGPDGRQYIAIMSGVGGDMGALIAGDVRADAPYDTRTPSDFLPELARHTSWGGMLWIFAL